ncbi:MAG: hypothetical protein NVS3B10_05730 [Polyangiales bacterium]
MIRLRDLTPAGVGEAATRHVHDRILRLAMGAGVGVDLEGRQARATYALAAEVEPRDAELAARIRLLAVEPVAAPTGEIARVCAELTRYAQAGIPPEGRLDLLHEYLISLVGVDLIPDDTEAEPDTPWGVVVLACLAREQIDTSRPVRGLWLAALGSSTEQTVRQEVARENLERVPSDRRYVSCPSARRWLSGRGVATGGTPAST